MRKLWYWIRCLWWIWRYPGIQLSDGRYDSAKTKQVWRDHDAKEPKLK